VALWSFTTFQNHIPVGGSNNFNLQYFSADDIFESVGDRELRQIFEGQNRIHLEIKQLNRQLDMILDEQRRYVSSLTEEISKRGVGPPGQHRQVRFQNPQMCLSLCWKGSRRERLLCSVFP
jgi:hypothetical protein